MFEVRNIKFGGRPAIAVPLTGRTEAEICAEAAAARTEADLIELRADAFEGIRDTMRLLDLQSVKAGFLMRILKNIWIFSGSRYRAAA